MKAAYLTGPRQIELLDEPAPRPTRAGEVLLRVDCVGVCGSDVHYWADGGIGSARVAYPQSLGHECAGTVVELGPGVERLRPGDRVAVDPAISCGRCDQCRAGRPNTCRELRFMGYPGEAPGAAAEFRTMPADNCLRIPDGMSMETAALVEPLSVAVYAVRLAGVYGPGRVAVLGSGPIGLGVLLCAKLQAPCRVAATDLIDQRLAVAERLGADWTGNPSRQDCVAGLRQLAPEGLDFVFECSGDPACLGQAAEMLMPGGALLQVGIPGVSRVEIDPHLFRRKELRWVNVRRQKGCIAPAIRMIDEGFLDPAPLLTHRFPLGRIAEAFELLADYRDGVIKATVELGGGG
ncbi:MAG: zinc-dependent alcohol dehydrogenase [Pirellulales bacterium]